MTEYTLADAARILDLAPTRLRYWHRTALVPSSASRGDQPAFEFRDLVCIRTVRELLDRGVPLRRIRRSVEALQERIPELEGEVLGSLRVWMEDSGRVVVRHEGALVEPDGQLVLDFQLAPDTPEDVATLRREPVAAPGPDLDRALECFERGCRLDGEPATQDEAVDAYRTAIEADPEFTDAYCNLGTVHYNRGERELAQLCYERALSLEPTHVEANFNLANLLEEAGADEAALRHYKTAMAVDPCYADLQLNVALLYEKLGLPRRAREHWRRYLQLAPKGNWADVARQRLEKEDPPA